MSLFKSWMQSSTTPSTASSPRSAPTQPTRRIPPPIASPATPRAPRITAPPPDRFRSQEADLTAHLQTLLDAQATGLLAGLHPDASEPPSNLSHSTLSTSLPDTSPSAALSATTLLPTGLTAPIRQPAEPTLSLPGARRGITRGIRALSALRAAEHAEASAAASQTSTALARIDEWQAKLASLSTQIDQARADGGADERVRDLSSRSAALDAEIADQEARLAALREQKRVLDAESKQVRSVLEARVSSFVGAREMVERDVRIFLKEGRIAGIEGEGTGEGEVEQGKGKEREERKKEGIWALPKNRRTLELAATDLRARHERDASRAERLEAEKEALDEGCALWVRVVGVVAGLEGELGRRLRGGMVGGVSALMRDAHDALEVELEVATARGWNLLVVAVGAEVEALRQGREMLRALLGEEGEESGLQTPDEVDPSTLGIERAESPEADRDGGFEGGARELERRDEDEPGPDLLVST